MKQQCKATLIFSALLLSTVLANISQGQMPLPVYMAPSAVATVPARHGCCRQAYYPAVVPVQVSYAAYYAPQVPVVPMSPWPTPTMSAFYVPTAPIAQTIYAPVMTTRRARRVAVPFAPAEIYPGYWLPY